MIAWLAGAALASPDPAELPAEAERAELLIARCLAQGRACGADDAALARAFVTRALAAAVLRGEVDEEAAATARYLDPTADDGLEDVLPLPGGAGPAPWVVRWRSGASIAPPPVRTRARPLELDHRDAPVVLASVADAAVTVVYRAGSDGGWATSSARVLSWGLQAQAPAGRVASLFGEAGLRHGERGLGVEGRLGVGPRWSSAGGADLHLVAAASAGSGRWTVEDDTTTSSSGPEILDDATSATVGLGIGGVGVHPLVPGEALALRWEAWWEQVGQVPGPPSTRGRARIAPALGWNRGGLVLVGGLLLEEDESWSAGPEGAVGWTW